MKFKIRLFLTCILMISGTSAAWSAQPLSISGVVTEKTSGEPIIGASVTIKGTTQGVVTDLDGKYKLEVPSADAVLVISYIGFKTIELPVNGQTTVNIALENDNKVLDEVVVTALGIKKDKAIIGYSVQDVKGDDLVKARDPNPLTGLTGKVAGLSVGQSAEMLRKPTVLLRGNELTLYVVDGVPISSDTWNISPDDIENYTVLKGATAAALYGSRAQTGAILITTKKGTAKKGMTIEFNSTNSFDKGFLTLPRTQNEYGGGENAIYAFGDGKGGGLNDGDYDVWGPKFRGQLIPQYDGEYNANETYTTTFGDYTWTGHIKPTAYIARGKDNLKNFMETGFQSTNNLSISNTGDNYVLRMSLSHSYQKSMIPNNDLNISNFNVYGSLKVSKKLKIEGNINYNRQYTDNFPDVDYGPNSLLYNVAIWTGADWSVNDPKIRGIWKDGKVGTESIFCEYQRYHNPWLMVYEWTRGHYKTDIYGYASANYKFNPHMDVNLRTQVSTYDLLRTEKMPFSAHPYGREENSGDYREDRRSLFDNNTDLQLNLNYMVGSFINISGLLGGNIRNLLYNSNFTSTDYLNIPNVYSFSNSKNALQANSFSSSMQVLSAYGSFDIGFDKYATLSITSRVDKSTALLPSKYTSYYYPSLSISSVISQYVNLPEAISYLKIRGSYASVRNDATSTTIGTAPFNTITALGGSTSNNIYGYPLGYGNNYYSPYGGPNFNLKSTYGTSKVYNSETSAYYTDNLINKEIKSSNRSNYEGGFDIKFFKNRLGIEYTSFLYIDGPQILANTISSTTGYTTYFINALKTKKTGTEITITGVPIMHPNGLTWEVTGNWDTYKETYLELPAGQSTYNTWYKKGDRVDKLYGSAFWRTPSGQIIYDAAGKPLRNAVSQYLGNENGKFRWSLNNRFTYKQVSMAFQVDGNVGGVIIDYMHNKTMRGGANIETVQGALGVARDLDDQNAGVGSYSGSYVGDGMVVSNGTSIAYDSETGKITNYDDLTFAANSTKVYVQDFVSKYYGTDESNLMSKTYAKLREVTLSYNLPSKWLSATKINKVSVSLVGRNLFYFYGDKRFRDVDLDQYNGVSSSTVLQSPTTRRFGFNINVVF